MGFVVILPHSNKREQQGRKIFESTRRRCVRKQLEMSAGSKPNTKLFLPSREMGIRILSIGRPWGAMYKAAVSWEFEGARKGSGAQIYPPMAPGSHFRRRLQPGQTQEKAPVKIWDCLFCQLKRGTKGRNIFESTAQHVRMRALGKPHK